MVRTKNRYIVVQIHPKAERKTLHLDDMQLRRCLLQNIEKYYGDYGMGITEHGFRIKYCNERTKIAIIRCAHQAHRYVASVLPFISLICDVRAKFQTVYTGATIMQCNKYIIKHQMSILERMVGGIESAKERKDFIQRVMEFELES